MTWRLRRVPLQIKLVAAVLALVFAALVAISVASTLALRSYLTGQVDDQLAETVQRMQTVGLPAQQRIRTVLPSEFVLLWRGPGDTFVLAHDARFDEGDFPKLPADLTEAMTMAGPPHTVTNQAGDTRWRRSVTILPDGTALTVARNLGDVDRAVARLTWIEVLIGGVALLLLAAAGAAMVHRSLRQLVQIEQTAEAIAGGDLTRRVPEVESGQPRTELGRLAGALNAMLSQIETAFTAQSASEERARRSEERMRRFVADASHELRTPLTSIRGFAELYRQTAAGSSDQADALVRRIENEAARMGLLVEDLLLLARLDQQRPLTFTRVDLLTVVTAAVEAARAVAPDRAISLDVPPDGALTVQADEARLRQVVDNLLSNALTHTPAGSPVAVRLATTDGEVVVEVADQGPGLTEEQAERVFERFYRVDVSRYRRPGAGAMPRTGTGLGLAIVAALVAAHRGTVEVDTVPGQGATFRVRLPVQPPTGSTNVQLISRPVIG